MKPRQPPKDREIRGKVPIPAGEEPGRCEWKSGSGPLLAKAEVFFVAGGTGRSFIRWHPRTLSCKECGQAYPLEARYVCERCFGPLEVAYDHSGLDPAEAKRKIQAGPADIWRYADFLPFAERPRDPLQPGLTPLVRADRLAERLGLGELWIKNDAANPTHSFKDRVVAVALAKARELGFETVACASTGNLANAVAAHAAAAGLDSYVFVPADLEEQKLLATGVYGTRLVGVRGQLRRRQPALHRALRDAPVGVRERQPAPVLRRGLEDDRLRDRRAARLVAARPGRLPDRLRLAVHEDRARASRSGSSSAWSRASCRPSTAPRPTAATRSPRRSRTAARSAGRSARRRSPRASRSATRPTAPTRSSWRGGPAARSTRSPTTRSAPASGCSPRPPASSPRPPAG